MGYNWLHMEHNSAVIYFEVENPCYYSAKGKIAARKLNKFYKSLKITGYTTKIVEDGQTKICEVSL